jgi:hypothetical protein
MKRTIAVSFSLILAFTTSVYLVKAQPKASVKPISAEAKGTPEPLFQGSGASAEGFPIVPSFASIIVPENFEDMIKKSDLVVIGRPLQSVAESTAHVRRTSDGYITHAYSETQFKVERVIKGSVPSATIQMGQSAAIVKEKGTTGYFMDVVEEFQPFVKNAKYVVFLKKGALSRPVYFPYGVYYGKVNLDGLDQGEKALDQKLDKSPGGELQRIRAQAKKRYQNDDDRSE